MRMPAEPDSGGSYRPIQPDEQFAVLVVGEVLPQPDVVEGSYYASLDRQQRRRVKRELKQP